MTAVFAPDMNIISGGLKEKLDAFMAKWDFRCLYKLYDWQARNKKWPRDRFVDGFPSILILEKQLTSHARASGITIGDIKDVAIWGGNDRNVSRIKSLCTPPIPGNLLYNSNGTHMSDLRSNPMRPIEELDKNTRQVGPTYLSKVLRFALPDQYGAIDTQCAQEFKKWVRFTVVGGQTGPNISRNGRGWLRSYSKWINILRYFAHKLNANQITCPHPQGFVDAGLRDGKTWACADVEMALFSYASHIIANPNGLGLLNCRVCNPDDDEFDRLQ